MPVRREGARVTVAFPCGSDGEGSLRVSLASWTRTANSHLRFHKGEARFSHQSDPAWYKGNAGTGARAQACPTPSQRRSVRVDRGTNATGDSTNAIVKCTVPIHPMSRIVIH